MKKIIVISFILLLVGNVFAGGYSSKTLKLNSDGRLQPQNNEEIYSNIVSAGITATTIQSARYTSSTQSDVTLTFDATNNAFYWDYDPTRTYLTEVISMKDKNFTIYPTNTYNYCFVNNKTGCGTITATIPQGFITEQMRLSFVALNGPIEITLTNNNDTSNQKMYFGGSSYRVARGITNTRMNLYGYADGSAFLDLTGTRNNAVRLRQQ